MGERIGRNDRNSSIERNGGVNADRERERKLAETRELIKEYEAQLEAAGGADVMTLPNNSFAVTPGVGETIATELISGKKYGVVMESGEAGHIKGTRASYIVIIPPAAATVAAANKVHFDFFNATGSGFEVQMHGIYITSPLDTSIAQALGIRFDLYRTSAVGTGGTAISNDQTSVTNTISKIDPGDSTIPAQITCRVAPGGGATTGAWIGETYLTTEESATNLGYYTQFMNMVRYENMDDSSNLIIPVNSGIKLVQGATAISSPNIGFRMIFTLM